MSVDPDATAPGSVVVGIALALLLLVWVEDAESTLNPRTSAAVEAASVRVRVREMRSPRSRRLSAGSGCSRGWLETVIGFVLGA